MTRIAVALLLAVAGCRASAEAVAETVKVGVKRAEVERRLGGPKTETEHASGTRAVYGYYITIRQRLGWWMRVSMDISDGLTAGGPLGFVFLPIWAPIVMLMNAGSDPVRVVRYEKRELTVQYDKQDRVAWFSGLEMSPAVLPEDAEDFSGALR